MRKRCGRTLILLAVTGVAAAAAVADLQTAQLLSERLRENQEALRDYTWKQRTEVTLDGDVKNVQLLQIRFDPDGELQKTLIAEEESERRRAAKKRKKQTQELYADVKALIDSYTHLSPELLRTIFVQGNVHRGQGERETQFRIQGKSVLRQGDSLVIWIDDTTLRPLRFEIFTSLEGEPVRVATEFAAIEDGPSYAARTTIETDVREKPLVLSIENFEHVRVD